MSQAASPPLTIWAVSDGRAGIEAQAVGLAEAVARQRPARIIVKRIGWKAGLGRLPWRLIPTSALAADSPLTAPWPDIWIAAGRATLPLSTRMRRRSEGATFVVQTQDPRTATSPFDLVVPPRHDGLAGGNVFPITGSPSRLTAHQLDTGRVGLGARLEALPHPRVAVIIGGASRAFDLSVGRAEAMADAIIQAVRVRGGSVMVSFTRRTPDDAKRVLTERLGDLPGWIWDGAGENPYFGFLGGADHILVTEDSINLAADAAATGKPVHVMAMDRRSGTAGRKFERFHADLVHQGISRAFTGELETWAYPALREADRAASELLRRYDLR